MSLKPSPYVSVYIARSQAAAAVVTLRRAAAGLAASSPVWKAIRTMEHALNIPEDPE